jgi:hypothetical protein
MLTTVHARAIASLVAVAALLGAFGAGRYSRPAKVVTRDVVRVETQVKTVVQEKVVHDVAVHTDAKQQTRTVTVTRWLPAPGGRTEVVQETHHDAASEAKTDRRAETTAQRQTDQDAHAISREDHSVTVEAARPAWSVTALAGAQLGGRNLLPGLPAPLVVGAAVERRIFGPVSVGAWATSGAAGGLSVRLEF